MNSLIYSDSIKCKIWSLSGDRTISTSLNINLFLTKLAGNNLRKKEDLNLIRDEQKTKLDLSILSTGHCLNKYLS